MHHASKSGFSLMFGLLLTAAATAAPAADLVLSGSSLNLDNSTRALANGRDGSAIRYALRVLDRNPDAVESAIAQHNLCLAYLAEGRAAEAAQYCSAAGAAQLSGVQVRRDGEFYVIAAGAAETLAAVIARNLAAHDAARIASTKSAE